MAKRGKKAEKLYYKIGEACKLVDIQPYVLRYWETEFAALKPNKSRSGQRVYSDKEIAVIRRIKQLLYEEGYTIAGAKKKLEAEVAAGAEPAATPEAAVEEAGGAAESAGLDTRGRERIERLRAGIEKALVETREILALLGGGAS